MSNYVTNFDDFGTQSSKSPLNNPSDHNEFNSSPPATAGSKKRKSILRNPDPDAEVMALSPRTLMATNGYVCDVCHKGFQRDQNLQLHRRGHNLPWKLRKKSTTQVKKRVYVCPELKCAHHDPSRAFNDVHVLKKHFYRKHSEKKWKCNKCSKRYAVQSDWKAHVKICGACEYRCNCGIIFSRKDRFVIHTGFCDAPTTEENNEVNQTHAPTGSMLLLDPQSNKMFTTPIPAFEPMNLSVSHENLTTCGLLNSLSLNTYSTISSGEASVNCGYNGETFAKSVNIRLGLDLTNYGHDHTSLAEAIFSDSSLFMQSSKGDSRNHHCLETRGFMQGSVETTIDFLGVETAPNCFSFGKN